MVSDLFLLQHVFSYDWQTINSQNEDNHYKVSEIGDDFKHQPLHRIPKVVTATIIQLLSTHLVFQQYELVHLLLDDLGPFHGLQDDVGVEHNRNDVEHHTAEVVHVGMLDVVRR